jgi:hypothetical protein
MAISLARPSPRSPAQQWAVLCSTHAQALRLSADGASQLQAERAVVEYGAAVAMDKAAVYWSNGRPELARVWMRAAASQLAAVLIEAPWHESARPPARPAGRGN